jgi:hypothetical protein
MANDDEKKPQVDTDAGLALHPENLVNLQAVLVDGQDSLAAPAYRAAYAAMEKVHTSAGAIVGLARELNQVSGNLSEERKAAASSSMGAAFIKASTLLDRAQQDIGTAMVNLTSRIQNAVLHPRRNDVSVASTAVQVRDFVKALPPLERMSFMMNAVDARDHPAVAAVIGGGPFISGFDRQQFAIVREFAERAFAPRETNQIDALKKLSERLDKGGVAFLERYARSIPRPDPKAARTSAAMKKLEAV